MMEKTHIILVMAMKAMAMIPPDQEGMVIIEKEILIEKAKGAR